MQLPLLGVPHENLFLIFFTKSQLLLVLTIWRFFVTKFVDIERGLSEFLKMY